MCLLELLTIKIKLRKDFLQDTQQVEKKIEEKMNLETMTTITHEITLTIEVLHKDLEAYKVKKFKTPKTTKTAQFKTCKARRWNSAL